MVQCSKAIIGMETTDVKGFRGQMRKNLLRRTINRSADRRF